MSKKHWPKLDYLIARESRHAYEAYARSQYEWELFEEKRRAKEGVRIQTLEQFKAGLARSRIRGRLLGDVYEWSNWITFDTREYEVTIFTKMPDPRDDDGEPAFSTLLDNRGFTVGLWDKDSLRLDHFVGWEEFSEKYHVWSKFGLPDNLIIAPLDVSDTGFVQSAHAMFPPPPQPNDGVYKEPTEAEANVLPKADCQGEVVVPEMPCAIGPTAPVPTSSLPTVTTSTASVPNLPTTLVNQYPNPPHRMY